MHWRGRLARRVALATCVLLGGAVLVGALTHGGHPARQVAGPHHVTVPVRAPGARPNIVFILTDDLSSNLVQYMPHVRALEKAGMSFTNYTVTDSLCCPSRSTIFSGRFPHDTKVFSNAGPQGGFTQFHRLGEEEHTFATALAAQGYRTALMGKYLNLYDPAAHISSTGLLPDVLANTWIPPGWSTWDVASNGYWEYNYEMNSNHKVVEGGDAPQDYLTDVINRYGQQFIKSSVSARKPFLLELATFSPHSPFTPAPQDLGKFPGLKAPRDPAFDKLPRNAPYWLASRKPLTKAQIRNIDRGFRKRVQAVQSVDRMIGDIEATVAAEGQAKNTIFVFSSDNGLHMGEYRLLPGKQTAFDIDIKVPLIVAGPGIPAGTTSAAVTQNTDLAPTFEQLAGAPIADDVDGRSLLPLLYGQDVPWRTVALIEHRGPVESPTDPDRQPYAAGDPPSYEAIRTATFTYIEYFDGTRDYYDRTRDPWELDNVYGSLPAARKRALHEELDALWNCHGGTQCWAAGKPTAAA